MKPKLEVKCTVENCKYQKKNNCYANNIMVNSSGDGHTKTSEGTVCSSFVDSVGSSQTMR